MKNIKEKFENGIKTRINIISSASSKKSELIKILIKEGIFDGTDYIAEENHTIFPTEILCSTPKSNIINVYLSVKKEEDMFLQLKNNIVDSIYEIYLIIKNKHCTSEEREYSEFKNNFCHEIDKFAEGSLKSFYEEKSIENVFKIINFKELFNELKKVNSLKSEEIINNEDEYIWVTFFKDFEENFRKRYYLWLKRISKYYSNNNEGNEFLNEEKELAWKYENNEFKNLCNILYGLDSSCALIIERVYIEVPSRNNQFSEIVYIDYVQASENKNLSKIIEERICQDYKELFLILSNSDEDITYFSKFRDRINKLTLKKRIFYAISKFNSYNNQASYDEIKSQINYENLINALEVKISKSMGISKDKIIITEQFKDIDRSTLRVSDTYNDFLGLIKLIKKDSENIRKVIKIKSSNKDNIISISLNQERMSVQALMGMFYERYHGYLMEIWNKTVDNGEKNKYNNKSYYSEIHTIIRNRKDDYKEYKYVVPSNSNQMKKRTIDFSLRNGDYNDSKRILKMLVNYGYNIVGFDSTENKIIVNINGEISREDKVTLINSIRGRLEECAINYFENAFLMNISKKKFNTNDLNKAIEIEKNITIDDFYSAFKEIFMKMSDNILRYEVNLQ